MKKTDMLLTSDTALVMGELPVVTCISVGKVEIWTGKKFETVTAWHDVDNDGDCPDYFYKNGFFHYIF